MASIAQLNAIAERNRPESDIRNQGLMQNAVVKKNTGVELHGQVANEHNYAASGGRKQGPQKVQHSNQTVIEDASNALALQQQTDVLRDQGVATQKQTGILDRQSGLMQEQIQATQAVSESVQRLYEYMKAEKSKPVAKVQNYGQGQGRTFEGEFSRVNEGDGFDPFGALDDINDLRRSRSERAKNQPRDKRGRFKSKGGKPGGFRLPKAGKLLKVGGGIGGALMVADGLMDISDHEGDDFLEGGLSSRGAGYAQAIGGGAMTGAAIGSVVPVIGTAVGAAVGAALGGLGALIMDNKKEISNGYNKIMGLPQDTRPTGRSEAQSKDIADAAMTKDIGSISQSFESGNKGVATISGGVGDAGGQSYGAHQLSSKSGSMTAFLRSEQGSKYYNEFRGLQPGSKEFNDKYKEVVGKDGAGMEAAQKEYITKSHYSPVAEWFQKTYGMDLGQHSRALKEALYSVGVQYGPGGAKTLIKEAFDGMDVAKTDDGQLIQKLQDYRASSVASKFKSSSGDVRQSIAGRARDENVALQKMLVNERTGQSGSGIGAVYSQQMMGAFGGKEQKGTGGSGNGTVGVMAMSQGGSGGAGAGGDEAGGGTAAEALNPADGALYNIGMKHTRPNDNSVNMAGLNPKFKKAWYTMVGDWVQNNNGGTVNVASAFRTRMEQEQLWVKYGRNTKRVARPGTSRHESGFAIDIDRNSAASLDRTGMFKKYGFHRPVPGEPWHVEMIGAVRNGGSPGGGAGAGESPQMMQQAASKEMVKAAEATVQTAEENTREKVKDSGAGGATPTDTETKPDAATEQGANAAAGEGEVKTDSAKAPAEAMGNAPAGGTGDDGKKPDGTQRTPEEQALYEQYLKKAGGDPRAVPESVADGKAANPFAKLTDPSVLLKAPGGTSPTPMGASNFTGASTPAPSSFGSSSGFNGMPQIYGGSNSVGGRIEVLPGVSVSGGITGPTLPHIPSPEEVVRGYENQAMSKVMGMIPQIPRISVNKGGVGIDAGMSVGNPFGYGNGPLTSIMKGNTPSLMSSSLSPNSPASPSYYRNETPVATRAASAPAQAIPMSVATEAKPDKIEQQKFDTVQQVAIADPGAMAGGGGGGAPAGGGGGAPKAGEKNDTAQLEEIPAIMEDLGILFINMGYV